MQIVLRRTLNKDRGLIEGTSLDWPRRTITAMSEQQGDDEWFEWGHEVQAAVNRQVTRPRRGRREKELV